MAESKVPTREEIARKYNLPTQAPQRLGVTPQEERAPVKPIVSSPVTRKKKSLGQKFADTFIGNGVTDLKGYIINVAIVPTVKTLVCRLMQDIPQLIFFGRTGGPVGYTNYSSSQPPWDTRRGSSGYRYDKIGVEASYYPTARTYQQPNYKFDDIIVGTAAEAESIRSEMLDRIEVYGAVTVAEVNDMLRVPSEAIDNDWGWYNIASCQIKQVRNGWMVSLPRCVYLKKPEK